MAKPLGFKDFITVDYRPGQDDHIKYRAKKRKMDLDRGLNDETQDEALDFSQRRAKARQLKKIKHKLAIGRKKAKTRTATKQKFQKRAQRDVRNQLFRKFAKGQSRSDVPMAKRKEIEKRIERLPSTRINALVKKSLPSVRKREMERKRTR